MFEKLTAWIKGVFGGKPAEDEPFKAPLSQLPQPIADFIERTRMRAPEQATEIGLLHQAVTPWEFADYCASFARGVAYVAKRFGTCPKAIVITDEDLYSVRYNADTQCIFVPRKAIATVLTLSTHRQSKTEPYVLNSYESATIYGVEEAYHHYQMTAMRAYYSRLKPEVKPDRSGYTEGYDNHPLEYDAERVVRQAIIEFGFDKHMYQMVPGTHPLTWCARVEQTTPQKIAATSLTAQATR